MKYRDENKIALIYKSSLKLIYKHGIAGLTMAKIAKESAIATGTLYLYFKSKEELITGLYQHLKNKSLASFLKGYQQHMPYKMKLKLVWTNYLQHRIENYKESLFMEQYYHSPYISTKEKQIAESMKTPIYSIIQEGKEEMLVRQDTETELLFLAMIGVIRELVNEHIKGYYQLDEDKIEKAFQLSWNMIKE